MYKWCPIFSLALCCLWVCAAPTWAGFVSELALQPRDAYGVDAATVVTLPRYLEVSGLTTATSEIVIVNAHTAPTQRGKILAIYRLSAGPSVRVLSESDWPSNALPLTPPTGTFITTAAAFPFTSLGLPASRSIWVFPAHTTLSVNQNILTSTAYYPGLIPNIFTFQPTASTPVSVLQGETVIGLNGHTDLARMNQPSNPSDIYYSGQADLQQIITHSTGRFRLNPGQVNFTENLPPQESPPDDPPSDDPPTDDPPPPHAPEPALASALLLIYVCTLRRCGRGSV